MFYWLGTRTELCKPETSCFWYYTDILASDHEQCYLTLAPLATCCILPGHDRVTQERESYPPHPNILNTHLSSSVLNTLRPSPYHPLIPVFSNKSIPRRTCGPSAWSFISSSSSDCLIDMQRTMQILPPRKWKRWQDSNKRYSRILGKRSLNTGPRALFDADGHYRFKPTPTLVTAFEARRLPRAYLVLLESLLNVKPSARPTCERVLNAIRERRVHELPKM